MKAKSRSRAGESGIIFKRDRPRVQLGLDHAERDNNLRDYGRQNGCTEAQRGQALRCKGMLVPLLTVHQVCILLSMLHAV